MSTGWPGISYSFKPPEICLSEAPEYWDQRDVPSHYWCFYPKSYPTLSIFTIICTVYDWHDRSRQPCMTTWRTATWLYRASGIAILLSIMHQVLEILWFTVVWQLHLFTWRWTCAQVYTHMGDTAEVISKMPALFLPTRDVWGLCWPQGSNLSVLPAF